MQNTCQRLHVSPPPSFSCFSKADWLSNSKVLLTWRVRYYPWYNQYGSTHAYILEWQHGRIFSWVTFLYITMEVVASLLSHSLPLLTCSLRLRWATAKLSCLCLTSSFVFLTWICCLYCCPSFYHPANGLSLIISYGRWSFFIYVLLFTFETCIFGVNIWMLFFPDQFAVGSLSKIFQFSIPYNTYHDSHGIFWHGSIYSCACSQGMLCV